MTRFNDNVFRGLILLALFFSLLLKSCAADAQRLTYLGYELAASAPSHRLSSNIPQLQDLKIAYTGLRIGGVMATHWAKYKATAGLHYSNASVPHSFDLLTAGLSAQVYLLRMGKVKRPHSFEPYFTTGLQQAKTNYFGTYALADRATNYSKAKETRQGSTYSTQLTTGAGIEYQLENANRSFIHFFSEINYGLPVYGAASSDRFEQTEIRSTWAINLGINFGIAKRR